MTMLRKTIALALVAGSLVLSACNTVEGAGEDLQSASQEVKEEIKD
jgi:predicted small secreted protein